MIPYSHVILEKQKIETKNAKNTLLQVFVAICIMVISVKAFVNRIIFLTALSTSISCFCITTVKRAMLNGNSKRKKDGQKS